MDEKEYLKFKYGKLDDFSKEAEQKYLDSLTYECRRLALIALLPLILLIVLTIVFKNAVLLTLIIIWSVAILFYFVPSIADLYFKKRRMNRLFSIPEEYMEVQLLQTSNQLYEDLRKDVTKVFIRRKGRYILVKYFESDNEYDLDPMRLHMASEFIDFSFLPDC